MCASIITVVISVLLSFLAAYLAARFAYLRFISERWWEYKIKSYEHIIESLYHIKKYVDNSLIELQHERYGHEREENINRSNKPSGDEHKKYQRTREQQNAAIEKLLGEKKKSGLEKIDRLIDVSEFVISKDARKTLIRFRKEWDNGILEDEEFEDGIERLLSLVSDCLSTFNRIRRDDLGITSYFLPLKIKQILKAMVGWAKGSVPTKNL